MDLNKLSNEQLGELYLQVVGYNPFEENKNVYPETETRTDCIEVLSDSIFTTEVNRELQEIYIEVGPHVITREKCTVICRPGRTSFRGVLNAEDRYTELTEFEARKTMVALANRIATAN
jgi:hypothetical protein